MVHGYHQKHAETGGALWVHEQTFLVAHQQRSNGRSTDAVLPASSHSHSRHPRTPAHHSHKRIKATTQWTLSSSSSSLPPRRPPPLPPLPRHLRCIVDRPQPFSIELLAKRCIAPRTKVTRGNQPTPTAAILQYPLHCLMPHIRWWV